MRATWSSSRRRAVRDQRRDLGSGFGAHGAGHHVRRVKLAGDCLLRLSSLLTRQILGLCYNFPQTVNKQPITTGASAGRFRRMPWEEGVPAQARGLMARLVRFKTTRQTTIGKELAMRLTTKGRFAVTAMIDLALRQNNGPVNRWQPSASASRFRCRTWSNSLANCVATSWWSPPAARVADIRWRARRRHHRGRHHRLGGRADGRHQCGGKENCLGDGGRCMTHDLWATLNQRMVEFLDSSRCKSWWTTSWPTASRSRNKPGHAPRHFHHAGGQAIRVNAPTGVCVGQRITQILSLPAWAAQACAGRERLKTMNSDPRRQMLPSQRDRHRISHLPGLRRHHARSTRVVVDAMVPWLREHFSNPQPQPRLGLGGRKAIETPRPSGRLIGADPRNRLDQRRHRVHQPGAQGRGPVLQGQGQAPDHPQDRAQGHAGHHARAGAPGLRGDLPGCQEDGLLDLDALSRPRSVPTPSWSACCS